MRLKQTIILQIWRFPTILKTPLLHKNLRPEDTKIDHKNIAKGYKYEFELHALYKDLNTKTDDEKISKHDFTTTPSQTNVDDCTWEEGVITFKWKSVAGANKYQLIIKDEFQEEKLVVPDHITHVTEKREGCQANIEMTDKLGIGRTCVTKVIAYIDEAISSTSDWKVHLIGGTKVARNVRASREAVNPFRALNISFDSPKDGNASEYKIVAMPSFGRKKIMFVKSSLCVFEYLRKGVPYSFEVWAKLGDTWHGPNISNNVTTAGDKAKPLFEVGTIKDSSLDLRKARFKEERKDITILQGDTFGKIRDLKHTYNKGTGADLVKLHWTEPTFGNNPTDYKLERFKIEIRKPNIDEGVDDYIEFDKEEQRYSTEEYKLDLEELYNVSVYTLYEDIDKDVMYVSNAATLLINTRPCQPYIHKNSPENDSLTIQWSEVKGAKNYEVKLFVENSLHPFTPEVKRTISVQPFDSNFGYGSSYYAVVRAWGEDGKYNETNTERKVIGGQHVSTNVKAKTDHEKVQDPNFEVFVTWTAPQVKPQEYKIEVIPDTTGKEIGKIEDNSCLISKLKAGTEYYFKVKAVHDGGIVSGGSCSNKVKTNPTPTQVKNVRFKAGEPPSTSQKLFWEKVDAERENETTEYRICLTSFDKETSAASERKITIQGEETTFNGLQPGASYSVTVAGGNSLGFGRESEKVTFEMEWGTAKNVTLSNNTDNPSTSLNLTLEKADGYVQCYMGTLYKYQNKTSQKIRNAQEVKSPHTFENLEPDTEYIAKVQVIAGKFSGKYTASNRAVTAPSQTTIDEGRCCKEGKEWSSRKLYVRWKADPGCNYHEITIKCGSFAEPECQLFARNKNEIEYSCQNEAAQYSIQVRSRNSSGLFGELSKRALVHLAPAKLDGVVAELLEKKEAISIRCLKPLYHSAFYFMEAFCDGKSVSEKTEKRENVDKAKVIEWTFNPTKPAKNYVFEVWGEDCKKVKGKRTVTVPVTSRPSEGELLMVEAMKNAPSTDVKITWKEQKRCDLYEVRIKAQGETNDENVGQYKGSSCTYRCLRPGDNYLISVRAICGSTKGIWSKEEIISLAPSEIEFIEDSSTDPVENVQVKWTALEVTPEGYLVVLFCDKERIKEINTNKTEHTFNQSLKPGTLCYCEVAAYNGKLQGKPARSKEYKIKWEKPDFFNIFLDENEPTRKAKMKWGHPSGVVQFKLEIENDQTGVTIHRETTESSYIFENGIPGNTYSVRLFCGCDGRYNKNFSEARIIFKPDPPTDIKVTANKEVNDLTIEFRDAVSSRKNYEICAEPLRSPENTIEEMTSQHRATLRDLDPGEGYIVSIRTKIDNAVSKTLSTDGYVHTFPDKVKNLCSRFEEGNIKFEWDPLDIKPDKYIVQWRVNNEAITDEHTEDTSFSICCVKPATWYRLRVMAYSKGNCGSMSEWKTFITRPSPPHFVKVKKDEKSPETSLIVRFEDDEDIYKSYKVTAWFNDEAEKVVTTKKHFALLKDLKPGTPYIITVQTIFYQKQSDMATVLRI